MNGFDVLKTNSRPQSPVKVLWFEFLLNPSLLEEHLLDPDCVPSAGELICHFLANATTAIQQANQAETMGCITPVDSPLSEASPSHVNNAREEAIAQERKKVLALKLLAIKVATFLRWDLVLLEKMLPLHMQSLLLTEFKKIVGIAEDDVADSWFSLTPEARFAYALYCRWVIQTLTGNSYPVRQPKGLTVQIPGQTDVMVCSPEATESLMAKVREICAHSEDILGKLIVDKPSMIMPLPECIGTITEEILTPNHRWDKGLVLNEDDVVCQVSYDLGCIAFFQENYSKAQTLFKRSCDLYSTLNNHVFSTMDYQKLHGFHMACESIVGTTSPSPEMRLKLEVSSTMNSKTICEILLEDNLKREISLPFRDNVELQILREKPRSELYAKVVIANAIRRASEGQVVYSNLASVLTVSTMSFFCDAVCAAGERLTGLAKLYLKRFVQLQKHYSKDLAEIMDQSKVPDILFSEDERLTAEERKNVLGIPRDLSFSNDTEAVISRLERDLVSARHPGDVRLLLKQLKDLTGKVALCSLNAGWEIPRSLQGLVKNLPPGIDQDFICILLAKALELRTAKCYEESCLMFKQVEQEVCDLSPHLASALEWELLHMDLLQFSADPDSYSAPKKQFILQKAKSCVSTVAEGHDPTTKPEVVELCAHVLFNWQEWEPLCNLDGRKGRALDFTKQLAILCREVRAQKGARGTARNVWNSILGMFLVTGGGPYKRSGGSKEISRDAEGTNPNKGPIIYFIKGLKDSFALTLIMSCLTKLHNILKDDSNLEIFLEHQNLWPAVLSNASQFNISSVAEVLQTVLQHSLSVIPTHVLWLKIHGDFLYVHGHYAAALGSYLASAIEASSYFSFPLPKVPFDDSLFRRMIHCCSRLQCYTQAALLCQCLEEPNYTQAFKSLAEKGCCDSTDTYFSHIWDVTLLEFLVNLHARRGEMERRNLAQQLMGVLELNANNNEEVQREAANIRKAKFLRAMAKQYL